MQDTIGCVDSKIQLQSGAMLDLLEPDPDLIRIEDIACSLSKSCRFNGRCRPFYSVAEHSILASELAQNDDVRNDLLIAFLMHDASEAYVGDVCKPLKNLLPEYVAIEERIQAAIVQRFNLPDVPRALIKQYDHQMLKAEQRELYPSADWGMDAITDRYVHFRWWNPKQAEAHFLRRFKMLSEYQGRK